jgi:hypothetical protein
VFEARRWTVIGSVEGCGGPDRADTAQEFGLAWRDRVGAGAQQLTGLPVEEQQRDAFDP